MSRRISGFVVDTGNGIFVFEGLARGVFRELIGVFVSLLFSSNILGGLGGRDSRKECRFAASWVSEEEDCDCCVVLELF